MTTKLVTYKKKLADGTIKEYVYERPAKDPSEPRKSRTRPISKRVLTEIIREFSSESLASLIEYAKLLAAKQAKEQPSIAEYFHPKSTESDETTDEIHEISEVQSENQEKSMAGC
jgi:hypothetical protein